MKLNFEKSLVEPCFGVWFENEMLFRFQRGNFSKRNG